MGTVGKPTRHRGRRMGLVAVLALVLGVGFALLPTGAVAVHDEGVFELDANVADDAVAGDDWANIFADTGSDLGHSFVEDKTGAEDDGFGSGLTKDTSDVTEWTTVTGAISPEKDDILHAYAATYVSGGEQFLYFGQDRAPKENGATSMGFWFFQDQVGPDGTGGFTGQHTVGDVLVTSDMTQGGVVSVVNVFKWTATGLVQVANLLDADCGATPNPDTACGIANQNAELTDVPWPYPEDTVPKNIFFEGGLNLSALFKDQTLPCFSSFLANTRTSPSETADLKDFVAGTIDTCGTITIHKNATPKSSQTFSYDATGTGLSDFTLVDSTAGADATETKAFGDLAPGSYSVAEISLAAGWHNTNLVCTTEGPGTSASTSTEDTGRTATITLGLAGKVDCTFSNEIRQPDVKIEKSTSTPTVTAGGLAKYTVTVSNIGNDDATNVHVTDDLPGSGWTIVPSVTGCSIDGSGNLDCTFATLAAGASKEITVQRGTTSADCAGLDNTATVTAANEPAGANGNNSAGPVHISVNCPDVKVEKTPDAGTIDAGQDAVFTVKVTNLGPGTATNVAVSDTLPGNGWAIDPAVTGCSLDGAGHVLTCNFTTLDAGDANAKTIVLKKATSAEDCTTLNNTATVSASNEDPSKSANNTDSGSISINCPNVTITKTAADDSIDAGDVASFTLVVENTGEGTATGVEVDDTLPGSGWAIDPPVEGCSLDAAGHVLSCSFETLEAGAENAVTIVLKKTTTAADCGTLDNTATVSADEDANSEDNESSASITVNCPDLQVVKTPDGSTIQSGAQAAFTVKVTNVGDGAAKDVTVSDALPGTGWSIDPAVAGCSVAGNPQVLTCSFESLAAGASVTIVLTKTTSTADCGTLNNQASAIAANEAEGDRANNSDTGSINVTCPPPPPPPAPLIDLAVTKVDTPDPATLNGQITYTMVVTNNGPSTATGVTAADPLPAGTSFVSVGTTQGTCANNGGLIQCSIGTLAKGASATITLVVTATQAGTVTNEVTVVGKEAESNTANNRATATTLVPSPAVPPTPKPKPKPAPVVCYTFTVSTKTLTVGKTKRVVVRVTLRGKAVAGAKVRIRGAGIDRTVRTGKNGRAILNIRAKKAGIVRINVLQKAVCGAKRIGVVGAFEPPVTG